MSYIPFKQEPQIVYGVFVGNNQNPTQIGVATSPENAKIMAETFRNRVSILPWIDKIKLDELHIPHTLDKCGQGDVYEIHNGKAYSYEDCVLNGNASDLEEEEEKEQ